MPLTQTQVVSFNAITNFIRALGEEFGGRQHSLALYARLIEHMTLSQESAIQKVVSGFSKFLVGNQLAVEKNSEEELNDHKIEYSDRVYISLKPLFRMADAETKGVMWRHLLTIYGLLFPDSQAKDILKKLNSQVPDANTEIISSMVQKIVPHLNADETNPMQAVMGLMSSGVFTELISTMQKGMDDGSVNMNSLLGTVSTMFAQPNLISPPSNLEEKRG